MTYRILSFLLCVSAALAQANPSDAQAKANQQKARAAIEQMIQALGGQAFLNVRNSQADGRVGRFEHGIAQPSTLFVRFWRWPDKERTEYTKARDVVTLMDGSAVYEITFRGARLLDPAKDPPLRLAMERRKHSLQIVLRQWLNETGTALFDEGPSLSENHATESISIINPQSDTVTLKVDTGSHLPVKLSFILRDPGTRGRTEIAEVYDNWKTVQGIATPYNTLVTRDGELFRQEFLTTVSYNNDLPDSLFTTATGIAHP